MKALILALLPLAASAGIALNPDVTQANIAQTVCVPGWSKSVRPPASFTDKIKRQKMAALGIPWSQAAEVELDHVVSIVLGGAPRDPANLRIQKWYGDPVATPADADGLDTQAHLKDVTEVALHRLVCSGRISLSEAQQCIYSDWRACAEKYPSTNAGGKPEGDLK